MLIPGVHDDHLLKITYNNKCFPVFVSGGHDDHLVKIFMMEGRPVLHMRNKASESTIVINLSKPINDGAWHRLEVIFVGGVSFAYFIPK